MIYIFINISSCSFLHFSFAKLFHSEVSGEEVRFA